ncbi:potassium-transporting ATPase subunit F [Listeria fleischmannii]|jgi:K+-transporting ATPase KdpF subunit|uniref:K+-transporting ATPase, F subunit n=2 Tax=Listeria fleischmannii TaxID=1069827 RepID=A0A2X3HDS3_9LIST|nr:potassium-transporting ATPase subunit F [Listeria fleischmannii]SQC68825.1 Uncharacterised protein [Listeria fleischmannii subsp. fleischmannii]MBC1398007.1 potassium-transporting ATPase subunit F [Listeria fleischmannii]MBC1417847.1 potassium-transporting ATPase subunit F [Listeria fleischmannii]MBC1426068.1 potassium-transporting ATPase subunit F [Listeria fleischmannii]STY34340.1 Uncharacterised protein [Listeria fleischmannii subsp. coloradonensis]
MSVVISILGILALILMAYLFYVLFRGENL